MWLMELNLFLLDTVSHFLRDFRQFKPRGSEIPGRNVVLKGQTGWGDLSGFSHLHILIVQKDYVEEG